MRLVSRASANWATRLRVEAPMTGFNQANKAGADLDQVGQLLVGEL